MPPASSRRYVRASGEIADQAVLDSLQAAYPQARVAHAFASTEAGVAFDVNDGRRRISARAHRRLRRRHRAESGGSDAANPLAAATPPAISAAQSKILMSDDGYVDTGDMVELVDGRYYFRGRIGGVINVGGLKVYPEEVESVLNADPRVRMSLVRARRNPITGAVVVADVVLADPAARGRTERP